MFFDTSKVVRPAVKRLIQQKYNRRSFISTCSVKTTFMFITNSVMLALAAKPELTSSNLTVADRRSLIPSSMSSVCVGLTRSLSTNSSKCSGGFWLRCLEPSNPQICSDSSIFPSFQTSNKSAALFCRASVPRREVT